MDSEIQKIYGNRLRTRVCGLCWDHDRLLLVNNLLNGSDFWAPPGGGLEFGETLQQALVREFSEETNLTVTTGAFLLGCEFIKPPLHAIELFFDVPSYSGILKTGQDPELPIIKDVKFMTWQEIKSIPEVNIHGLFRFAKTVRELKALKGFYVL